MKTRVWREGKRCSWEEDRHRFTYPFSRGVLRQEGVWLDEGFKVETKKQVPLHNNTPVLHQFPWRFVRYILATKDMNLPNGEHETSLFNLLTFVQAAKVKIVTSQSYCF